MRKGTERIQETVYSGENEGDPPGRATEVASQRPAVTASHSALSLLLSYMVKTVHCVYSALNRSPNLGPQLERLLPTDVQADPGSQRATFLCVEEKTDFFTRVFLLN